MPVQAFDQSRKRRASPFERSSRTVPPSTCRWREGRTCRSSDQVSGNLVLGALAACRGILRVSDVVAELLWQREYLWARPGILSSRLTWQLPRNPLIRDERNSIHGHA